MKYKGLSYFLVPVVITVFLSLACGGSDPIEIGEIPVFPFATYTEDGQNALVDDLAQSVDAIMISGELDGFYVSDKATARYTIPNDTSWDSIESFYKGELKDTDWEYYNTVRAPSSAFADVAIGMWLEGSAGSEGQMLFVGYTSTTALSIYGNRAALVVSLVTINAE